MDNLLFFDGLIGFTAPFYAAQASMEYSIPVFPQKAIGSRWDVSVPAAFSPAGGWKSADFPLRSRSFCGTMLQHTLHII
jgi:hypothetical protein